MYYPFLRARQFELISLRELAAERAIQGQVVPVIEPVKDTVSNLSLANRILHDSGQQVYLILNPLVGERSGDHEFFCDYISSLGNSAFLPAFQYNDNANFITSTISKFSFNNCMLVCYSNFTDDNELRNLCRNSSISHLMVFEPHKNRSLDRFVKSLQKTYIRLDDVFEKKEKNSDFLDVTAHKFSEEHLYYEEDGYQGFSDFTVLPSEFIDGGSTPRAVVIHLTYINPDEENQVWVRHFTSNTNDSIANVQGKFAEAAGKALIFCNNFNLDNTAIQELRAYFDGKKYPGLGTVKKISIKNHLLIISSYLR